MHPDQTDPSSEAPGDPIVEGAADGDGAGDGDGGSDRAGETVAQDRPLPVSLPIATVPSGPPADSVARLERLLQKARDLPRVPGVYLMKDAEGRVIYVGKAGVLPNRVSSYFVRSADLGFKKQPMLAAIVDFDVITCESEWEAMLMENRLIKDTRPRFNVRLTDDKSYPYLAVTMRDDFPGVYLTRTPTDERFKGAKLFGPFTSVASLREAIQLLQRVFRYRTCELEITAGDPRNERFRPCLLHAIGQCTAPCANRIDAERYGEDIERFLRFLGSKRSTMMREMEEEMRAAAGRHEFERAAVLRDQIKAIDRLGDRDRKAIKGRKGAGGGDGSGQFDWQPEVTIFSGDPTQGLRSLQRTLQIEVPIRCMEAIDIAHLGGGETVGSKVCFIDGRPFKDGYRRYKVRTAGNDDYEAIREVVSRRYRDAGEGQELYPDVILIDGGLGQLHAALEAFESLSIHPPMVISLAKKEELIFVQRRAEPIRLGRENPGLKLCQAIRDEAHRFAQHYHHILRRKSLLDDA